MTRPGGVAATSLLLCALLAPSCSSEPETDAEPPAELETSAAGLTGPVETTDPADKPEAALEIPDASGLEPGALPPGAEEERGFLSTENQQRILLFFPSASSSQLIPEQRIIFLTDTLTSQVKQAVSELIAGPMTEGLLAPFPEGTSLEGVFLPGNGLALIDLGQRVLSMPSGSDWEQVALYSLVNTVVHNFAEIHQVQILVQGQEVTTLAGHLDAQRPLSADMRRVDWMFQRLLNDDGDFLPYGLGPVLPEGWVPPESLPEPEALPPLPDTNPI